MKKDFKAYKMSPMFSWDTSLITDMSELFKDRTNFNEDISLWNVSAVTNNVINV